MKKIYAILVAFVAVLFTACTNKEDFAQEEMGYLTLEISAPKGTRAIPADYNPKQLYVEVVDKNGTIVLSTDDASKWAGETLKLRAGTYTVNAHSNNWDGGDAGKDAPFYAGTTTVTVIQGQKSEAELTCTLANVKVSVEFDETVAAAFKKVSVDVFSALSGVETMHFEMGGTLTPAYFPVGRLTARLTVVNKADETYTMDTPISDVKARDHFIFKYSTKAVGQTGAFTVTADDAQNIFTYNFYVPVHASTQLKLSPVNAWGRFAYAQGSISLEKGAAEASKATIQYQKKGDSEWQSVAVTMTGEDVKATLTGLTPATDYACKVAYADEDGTIYSNVQEFTTEAEAQMPNSNMDDWYKGKFDTYECVYPCSQSYWEQQGGSFWGTSNAGTALLNKAITNEEKTDVHTEGGSSAKLSSQYIVFKFAAASLFAGTFKELVGTSGGKIEFGQAFTSRPTKFTGYYKYSTDKINRVGTLPSYLQGKVSKSDEDTWSCFVALMTESFVFDNSTTEKASSQKYVEAGTMPDFETDPRVIAYGEMPMEECKGQADWKQFSVDLKYHDLTKKPAVIVVVISASRYGDFFTGYDKSTLLVDDLKLEYGQPE